MQGNNKQFKQLKFFLRKEILFLLTLPVCTVCPVQIAYGVLKNFISKMAIIYTTEADVEAWAEENVNDDHHYSYDSQFWHSGVEGW